MKRKKSKFFASLGIVLSIIIVFVVGFYFVLDKLLVPKYFSKYNIHNMKELTDVVKTMYVIPDESTFINNPFTKNDETSAENKLLSVGFPKTASGKIDYSKITGEDFAVITSPDYEDDHLGLTDREIAAVMAQILDSGVLVPELGGLSYLDTLNMYVKEVSITPLGTNKSIVIGKETFESFSEANISIIIKIDMTSAISRMAESFDTPLFLLNMLIPNTVYMSTSFDAVKNEDGSWGYKNSSLSINGKTAKQSEVVLNLLISFIYSNDPTMTIQKLADEISSMSLLCFDLIGDINFTKGIKNGSLSQNGVIIHLLKAD